MGLKHYRYTVYSRSRDKFYNKLCNDIAVVPLSVCHGFDTAVKY